MQNNPTMLLVVAAALQSDSGSIFLQKRPQGRSMAGLWEFPGGKVEGNESPETALVRELLEELAIEVNPDDLVPCCFASADIEGRPLVLLLFLCHRWQGTPTGIESPEIGWFKLEEMRQLPMPPADLPLLEHLERLGV